MEALEEALELADVDELFEFEEPLDELVEEASCVFDEPDDSAEELELALLEFCSPWSVR